MAPRLGLAAIVMANGGSAETMVIAQALPTKLPGQIGGSIRPAQGAKNERTAEKRVDLVLSLIKQPSLKVLKLYFARFLEAGQTGDSDGHVPESRQRGGTLPVRTSGTPYGGEWSGCSAGATMRELSYWWGSKIRPHIESQDFP